MGITRKQKGPMPTFPYRWQNIATDKSRAMDATRMYREENKNASLVEASRAVRRFQQQHL